MTNGTDGRETLKLLAVLAHPDDETFGMGGTLAYYARRGVETHLVTATRGEAGEIDERYLQGYASIAEVRENELRCAASLLGLTQVYFMDYCDSGYIGSSVNERPDSLINAPLEEVVQRIVRYIRDIRPQVVVTFDPIGGYRHPDHIFIHQATVKAFYAAGDPAQYPEAGEPYSPRKLYYHVISHNLLRVGVRIMPIFGIDPRHYGRNKDIDLMSLVSVHFPIHARIDYGSVAAIREQASACHASQDGAQETKGVYAFLRRLLMSKDEYMRAHPVAEDGLRETDLFAGV